jgi:soluble lytic murein transglycosylase
MRRKRKKAVKKKNLELVLIVLLWILFAFPAPCWHSEATAGAIYSFIDEKGVYHFTNVPVDPRFSKTEFTAESAIIHGKGSKKTSYSKKKYHSIIRKAANSFGLDPALVKAVIRAESGGNPSAVSPKGALGLMQLMPGTAEELMVYDPLDPEENIWGGSQYLSRLLDMFDGDIISALAAYNAGPGAVEKFGGLPPYRETINYVQRVLRFWKQSKF